MNREITIRPKTEDEDISPISIGFDEACLYFRMSPVGCDGYHECYLELDDAMRVLAKVREAVAHIASVEAHQDPDGFVERYLRGPK